MGALLETLTAGPGGVGALRAGQVDQVDLGQGLVGHPLHVAGLHKGDGEDGVRPGGDIPRRQKEWNEYTRN